MSSCQPRGEARSAGPLCRVVTADERDGRGRPTRRLVLLDVYDRLVAANDGFLDQHAEHWCREKAHGDRELRRALHPICQKEAVGQYFLFRVGELLGALSKNSSQLLLLGHRLSLQSGRYYDE